MTEQDTVTPEEVVQDTPVEAEATESVLDAAAALYLAGKDDEAFKLILDSLGEEAAASAREAFRVELDDNNKDVALD